MVKSRNIHLFLAANLYLLPQNTAKTMRNKIRRTNTTEYQFNSILCSSIYSSNKLSYSDWDISGEQLLSLRLQLRNTSHLKVHIITPMYYHLIKWDIPNKLSASRGLILTAVASLIQVIWRTVFIWW